MNEYDFDMEHIGVGLPADDQGPQRVSPSRGAGRRRSSQQQQAATPPTPREFEVSSSTGYSMIDATADQHAEERVRPSHKKGVVSQSDMNQVRGLKEMGFSTGLAKALAVNKDAFLYRIWVVDNSGSMIIGDGHRVVQTADQKIKAQAVTRWEELQDAVVYHAQISAILHSPSIFTLLNDPGEKAGSQQFSVAMHKHSNVDNEVRQARTLMQRTKPTGVTPLTPHIYKIQQTVQRIAPRLRREGKRIAVILATDGLPTDAEGYDGEEVREEFVHALRALEGLPLWLVIRLCTDEAEVTEFYNDLDAKLELSLEVLDDFLGEAKEVHSKNKWLNYALPIHRSRELGYQDRLFDLLDERPLTKGELRDFCSLLFGTDVEVIPDPVTDWKGFIRYVEASLSCEQEHWDPIKKKVAPWINVKAMQKSYGKRGFFRG